MKFSVLATLLPLFLSASITYAAPSQDMIQARRAHARRGTTDVCTALDVDVQLASGGQTIAPGHLDTCLCESAVSGFLGSNDVAKKLVDGAGKDSAQDYFTKLIQSQANKQTCSYPTHASPACSVDLPCDFTCGDGFTPSPATGPTDCVCSPPNVECNGVCGSFAQGCDSQDPSKAQDSPKTQDSSNKAQDPSKGKRDNPTCPAGQTLCGVPNNGSGYQCVDVTGSADMCGGCTVASPFGGNTGGKSCKDIPNVDNVTCENGVCKVLSCKNGLKVASSNDKCV